MATGEGCTVNDVMLDERETARYLNMSVSALQSWRRRLQGPPFIRLGRSVRYAKRDLDQHIDGRRVETK